ACFNAGSYLYFERRILEAMHEAGRRAAGGWLAPGPRGGGLGEPAPPLAATVDWRRRTARPQCPGRPKVSTHSRAISTTMIHSRTSSRQFDAWSESFW